MATTASAPVSPERGSRWAARATVSMSGVEGSQAESSTSVAPAPQ